MSNIIDIREETRKHTDAIVEIVYDMFDWRSFCSILDCFQYSLTGRVKDAIVEEAHYYGIMEGKYE